MNTTAPTLDPRVLRFAREATPEMSTEQARSILGVSRDSVVQLCKHGQLAAIELSEARCKTVEEAAARWQAEHPGEELPPRLKDAALYQATKRTSKRLTITAAALLRYILDSTVGDKSLTLQAIQTHCPAWHAHAIQWAQRVTTHGESEHAAGREPRRKARRTDGHNIIPFDPKADLFPHIKPAARVVA